METYGIEKYGIIGPKAVYRNLTPAELTEAALRRGEGSLSKTGALVVTTGKYTGRSPNDKFIVDSEGVHDDIAWGKVNKPISREKFDAIKGKVAAYLQGREIFIFDGYAGADQGGRLPAGPRDLHLRRLRRRRPQVHQEVPHHQRAGQPKPVHPSAADPAHRRAAGRVRRARLHHAGGPRLQVRPRGRRRQQRGRHHDRL